MNLLVTGGAGFIGSNFIKHYFSVYSDSKIVNLDKLTYAGRLENLKEIESNKNYSFIKGDICDKKVVEKAAKDSDIIINFAAESHVDRSIVSPEDFIKTDVFGTFVLLEEARKKDLEFIQISTDEVYGSIESGLFSEESALMPSSPYSASKAGADRLAFSYFKTYDLNVKITRSSNNFGPNQFPEKLIPLFITNLLEQKKVPVYGDGKNIRDWIYVKDNCDAVIKVMEKGKKGETYNVGGGNEKSNLFITDFILNELGKEKDSIEFVEDRKGHDWRYALNCDKIKKLGFIPEHSFEQALKETIKWYKNNSWWWKPLKKK
ncbi:MAG: dTDP-glucose 4,6-dehydratase [Candidatus Diapherotrites archaeon CG10_big_fil_rev_8_21_14_0_10_31_34]|nr:MAG: dTDP-glucose 4,6-dehydratase [Candidatus Diapherotrites archaeon CG10_big_fil_rev_8_21_14_0_10_31_34]